MKFKKPLLNDKRIREKFLIFPKEINDESCWFEKAKWEEVYAQTLRFGPNEWPTPILRWTPVQWLN